jgi:pimeloyl-ACP methyl ester carboxylesterase
LVLRKLTANGSSFTALEAGSGPLALCLNGFPDSAHTWRHLLPALADAGFNAVASFMRGYAPTDVPADRRYDVGALAADALAIHDTLGGDRNAVLIGHDWGAEAAYGAAALAPERWRRLVTLSVPPPALDDSLFADYDQLKRFFYLFALQMPGATRLVEADGMSFLDRLSGEWSPGYDAAEDLARAKACLQGPANLSAAIAYYRQAASPECQQYERHRAPAGQTPAVPRAPPHPRSARSSRRRSPRLRHLAGPHAGRTRAKSPTHLATA